MINLCFGLPRAGKTTYISYLAAYHQARIDAGISKYKYVYTNVPVDVRGVRFLPAVKDVLWNFDICDSILLLDEGTLLFNSRKFKDFTDELTRFFVLSGHLKIDVWLFTQRWDGIDIQIRNIVERVYYIHKGKFNRKWSYVVSVPYQVAFPQTIDGKDAVGDIAMGYKKPPRLNRLLAKRLYLPAFYSSFDSFERPYFRPLPAAMYQEM